MCWRCREHERLFNGTYKPVPWANEEWALKGWYEDDFVHISTVNPRLVAYTPNDDYGERDRQVSVTPGRYLERFYSVERGERGRVLTQKDIQYWCGVFKGTAPEAKLLFATNREEIAYVYANGPDSCMSGEPDGFETDGIHPAEAYAAGDLAVAYTRRGDGRISARAVCWPKKKIFGRMYGDAAMLRTLLEREGYREACSSEFDGARLLRIELGGGYFVCPYLDIGSSRRVADDGEYLIVGEGDINANNTDGTAYAGDCCPACNHRTHRDNFAYVRDVGEYWCHDCIYELGTCEWCGYHATELHETRDERYVCCICLDASFVMCDVCEMPHARGDRLCEPEEEEEESEAEPSPTVTDDPRQPAFL